MDTILEFNAATDLEFNAATDLEFNAAPESVRQAFDGVSGEPDPRWVRGFCPHCLERGVDSPVVSNCYYVGGSAYLITHECWLSLKDQMLSPSERRCEYRRVL